LAKWPRRAGEGRRKKTRSGKTERGGHQIGGLRGRGELRGGGAGKGCAGLFKLLKRCGTQGLNKAGQVVEDYPGYINKNNKQY